MARPKLRLPDQPLPLRIMLGICEAFASLRLAVVVIAVYATGLGWATFVESWYGTPAAQFGIYQTWWFAALNALLGLNVLCAALIRFPWKRYQTGFLVTHAGILVLLFGCLLTQQRGIEADLPIFEGRTAWRAFQSSQHFSLTIHPRATAEAGHSNDNPATGTDTSSDAGTSGKTPARAEAETIAVAFSAGPFNWDDYKQKLFWFPWRLARRDRGLIYDRRGVKLEVLDYYGDSVRLPAPQVKLRLSERSSRAESAGPLPADHSQRVRLSVQATNRNLQMPHGRFGIGSRQELTGGGRITFWMTGSRAETDAFRDSHPEGPVSGLGQLVLHAGGTKFALSVDELDELRDQAPQPLGTSGLKVQMVRFDPRFLSVQLQIHAEGDPPQSMLLLADFPELSRQDYRHGVFGSYWFDASGEAPKGAAGQINEKMIRSARRPRIDILLGADQKLYYRTWKSPQAGTIAPLPVDGTEVVTFENSDGPLALCVEELIKRQKPGTIVRPLPFDKNPKKVKQPRVRVQVTVDGTAEEFWLARSGMDLLGQPPREDQRHVVEGRDRRVTISLAPDEIDLGFQVYLHKFERKLDPGTSNASHYSSLVEFRHRHDEQKRLLEQKVRINLNDPADFSDPYTGRSYRLFQSSFGGPWGPDDPYFNQLVETGSTRDRIFLSRLSVNYDPGRGLKYAGSLLITAGIGIMFYMKAYFFRRRPMGA